MSAQNKFDTGFVLVTESLPTSISWRVPHLELWKQRLKAQHVLTTFILVLAKKLFINTAKKQRNHFQEFINTEQPFILTVKYNFTPEVIITYYLMIPGYWATKSSIYTLQTIKSSVVRSERVYSGLWEKNINILSSIIAPENYHKHECQNQWFC